MDLAFNNPQCRVPGYWAPAMQWMSRFLITGQCPQTENKMFGAYCSQILIFFSEFDSFLRNASINRSTYLLAISAMQLSFSEKEMASGSSVHKAESKIKLLHKCFTKIKVDSRRMTDEEIDVQAQLADFFQNIADIEKAKAERSREICRKSLRLVS